MKPPETATAPAATEGQQTALILIVDDLASNLKVVGNMLHDEGYRVMPASSGQQALDRVAHKVPDLILLDLMMPVMDGIEVCQRLKASQGTRDIPVIFLTASNEMEHLMKAFQVGAVDYITKPFNSHELLARVTTHLELKHSRDIIEQANREKSEFLGIAAHDLKNPLTNISMLVDMISSGRYESEDERDRFLNMIKSASNRMLELIDNLLSVNAIELGKLDTNIRQTDMVSIVLHSLQNFQEQAARKEQQLVSNTLDMETQALVNADARLLGQSLDNLVSNAIKFSPAGKTIEINIELTETHATCSVRDEGPGLTEEDHKKLFKKFSRLSARPTAKENSTGLGLSIVKKLIDMMNGRIWCESVKGEGATFYIELPLASPQKP